MSTGIATLRKFLIVDYFSFPCAKIEIHVQGFVCETEQNEIKQSA